MITIKDIALACGVSINTVSRSINDKPDVSSATKKKVLEHVEKVGFIPNYNAKGMSSNRRFLIGLVFCASHEPLALIQLVSIIRHAQINGYGTVCQTLVDGQEKSFNGYRKLIENIIVHNPEGIILDYQLLNGYKEEVIEFINKKGIPLTLFNAVPPITNCSAIIQDVGKAVEISTEFLIDKGFEQVAYVGWAQESGKFKFEGYMRALQKRMVDFNPECLIDTFAFNTSVKIDFIRKKINRLLEKNRNFGVFCSSFWLAAAVEKIVLEKGLSVPENVCIICVGHDPLNSVLHTPILCCKTNVEEIGIKTIKFIKEERKNGTHNIYEQKWTVG